MSAASRRGGGKGGGKGGPGSKGGSGGAPESKICPACGLPFENRKKWASRGLWDSIVYCSERCRRTGRPAKGAGDGSGAG